jgi:hypothetical protein
VDFFTTWAKSIPAEELTEIQPAAYHMCFNRALCRMSVYLNRNKCGQPIELNELAYSDGDLFGRVEEQSSFSKAFVIEASTLVNDGGMSEDDIATNFFYGDLRFDSTSTPGFTRIIYSLPQAFLNYSYKGFRVPPYSKDQVNPDSLDPLEFVSNCATNYILRNLWHNFVHTKVHKIGRNNYSDFEGDARYAMDFEADNLSLLLLVASYGYPLKHDGFDDTRSNKDILLLLRRNRCNKMFADRAQARSTAERSNGDQVEEILEGGWRLRRTLCGYISGWLIAHGLCAINLSVFHSGSILRAGNTYKRNKSGIIVSVNGVQIYLDIPIPQKNCSGKETRAFCRQVATKVHVDYLTVLRKDSNLKHAVGKALEYIMQHRLVA